MKECCGICYYYEHSSGYCDSPLPASASTCEERWMKPTYGQHCDLFILVCPNCCETCKNAGKLYSFPKTCKLMKKAK